MGNNKKHSPKSNLYAVSLVVSVASYTEYFTTLNRLNCIIWACDPDISTPSKVTCKCSSDIVSKHISMGRNLCMTTSHPVREDWSGSNITAMPCPLPASLETGMCKHKSGDGQCLSFFFSLFFQSFCFHFSSNLLKFLGNVRNIPQNLKDLHRNLCKTYLWPTNWGKLITFVARQTLEISGCTMIDDLHITCVQMWALNVMVNEPQLTCFPLR